MFDDQTFDNRFSPVRAAVNASQNGKKKKQIPGQVNISDHGGGLASVDDGGGMEDGSINAQAKHLIRFGDTNDSNSNVSCFVDNDNGGYVK